MLNEIRYNSKWKANKQFSIGIGSHSMNPNTTSLIIPKGEILTWENDSPNGNVWFRVEMNGIKYRGKVEAGRITNIIKDGEIELVENGNAHVAYHGDYLQMLLNN